ncbi:hypothetical protein [Pseudanabaena sp. BC1403]|uniref:hypothetical protein n=1 Tax=Pseudanabaena sp. BC1403 TaxID=2043171 RepID=UPI0015E1AB2A|nr:hypothetical protein [Pseudanabaena sp. BC1403]
MPADRKESLFEIRKHVPFHLRGIDDGLFKIFRSFTIVSAFTKTVPRRSHQED